MTQQNNNQEPLQASGQQPAAAPTAYDNSYYARSKPRKTWLWILIGAAVFLALIIAVIVGTSRENSYNYNINSEHIAVIYVEGTISSVDSSSYNHSFLLETIDHLIDNRSNMGLLVYIDSPGGELLAGAELTDKIEEYRELTGRPVYMYGHRYMASGGYWLACAGDMIFANEYCITGSIGVAYGSMLDISGLLDKMGVTVNTITSGAQKSMGSYLEEMTPETKAIYQTMIDEYYNDFVLWIAENRPLEKDQVISLADGRIYSARQAVELKLIDEVGDYDTALAAMQEELGYSYPAREYIPLYTPSLLEQLLSLDYQGSDINALLEFLPPSGPISYYAGY